MLVGVLTLVVSNWPVIQDAAERIGNVHPGWLLLSVAAIGAGFVCAGQIYAHILGMMGYSAPQPWRITAALVSALISQAIPAGTFASFAFLTTSLRRRGIPVTSVALLASLELLTWIGGMLALFGFGVVYKLLWFGDGESAQSALPVVAVALVLMGGVTFAATRPIVTLEHWATLGMRVVQRIFRRSPSAERVQQIIAEIDAHRRLITERPVRTLRLLGLQVLVFAWHSLALLVLLHALGVNAPPFGVLAAYGLALIVSTFTALPGGGGAVEAALVLALTSEGVPPDAALGATLLFRALSFWLLLPVGAVGYRVLTRP
jgi:uncharacterized protein (TIRG00374 family)